MDLCVGAGEAEGLNMQGEGSESGGLREGRVGKWEIVNLLSKCRSIACESIRFMRFSFWLLFYTARRKKPDGFFSGCETRAENWTGCSSRLAVPYGVQITRKMRTNIPTHLFSRFVLVFLSNRKRCKTQLKVWFSRKNMLDMNLLWDILVCILIRPTGPPKYYKRRKNIQRTWITYFRLAKFN